MSNQCCYLAGIEKSSCCRAHNCCDRRARMVRKENRGCCGASLQGQCAPCCEQIDEVSKELGELAIEAQNIAKCAPRCETTFTCGCRSCDCCDSKERQKSKNASGCKCEANCDCDRCVCCDTKPNQKNIVFCGNNRAECKCEANCGCDRCTCCNLNENQQKNTIFHKNCAPCCETVKERKCCKCCGQGNLRTTTSLGKTYAPCCRQTKTRKFFGANAAGFDESNLCSKGVKCC